MPPKYDPSGHPLLSAAAQRLAPEELSERARAAELQLRRGPTRLADTAFEPGTQQREEAVLAVVYQVNYQLEAGPEAEVYSEGARGDRRHTFRGGVLAGMPPISPAAQAIIDELIPLVEPAPPTPAPWPSAGSLR